MAGQKRRTAYSQHAVSPERRQRFVSFGLTKNTPTNYCDAMGDLVAEDMARSELFASINSPGPSGYDALIRLNCFEDTKGDQCRLTVTMSVLDPGGKDQIAQYHWERSAGPGDEGWPAAMKAIRPGLAAIRAQMLAGLGGGSGLKAAMATKRAVATAQDTLGKAQGRQGQGNYAAAWAALRQALAQDQRSPAPALTAASLLTRLCDAEGARVIQAEAQRRSPGAAPHPPAEPDPRACQAQTLNKEGVSLARLGSTAICPFRSHPARRGPGPPPSPAPDLI